MIFNFFFFFFLNRSSRAVVCPNWITWHWEQPSADSTACLPCEVPDSDHSYWIGVKVIVAWSFHVTEDSVNQFRCGTLGLVLINGSHSPRGVSPSWLTTRSHASAQHISQPTLSLPLIRGCSETWVFMFCAEHGVPHSWDPATCL